MNAGLTRWQVEDILAASENVDVPAGLMLAAAEEIRAALLGDIAESTRRVAANVSSFRTSKPTRRARVRVTAVCAATIVLAVLLGAASTGALPMAVQHRVAKVSGLVGINLPDANPGDASDADAVRVGHGNGSTPGATPTRAAAEKGAGSGTSGLHQSDAAGAPHLGLDSASGGNPNASIGDNPSSGHGDNDSDVDENNAGNADKNAGGNQGSNSGGNGNQGLNGDNENNSAVGNPSKNAGGNPDNSRENEDTGRNT